MGRNSGGSNPYASGGGGNSIAVNSNGKRVSAKTMAKIQGSAQSLDSLQHREVVKQLNRAISRYEAVMGVRERNIQVADVPGAYGVTYLTGKGSEHIYLSKSFFNQSRNQIEAQYRKKNYDTGFKNATNRPIQHTLTHELAHATWTSNYTGAKHQAAGKEIKSLYKSFLKDKKAKGYGSYGKSNVDEFWAEVVTKGIHGKADKYTKKAISIAKKYKL